MKELLKMALLKYATVLNCKIRITFYNYKRPQKYVCFNNLIQNWSFKLFLNIQLKTTLVRTHSKKKKKNCEKMNLVKY